MARWKLPPLRPAKTAASARVLKSTPLANLQQRVATAAANRPRPLANAVANAKSGDRRRALPQGQGAELLLGLAASALPNKGKFGRIKSGLGALSNWGQNIFSLRDNQAMADLARVGLFGGEVDPNASVADVTTGIGQGVNDLTGGQGILPWTAGDIQAGTQETLDLLQGNLFEDLNAVTGRANTMGRNIDEYGRTVLNDYDQYMNTTMPIFQERYNRGMGYIDEMSDQQTRDVNTQFDNLNASTRAQMARSGLGNSTVGASMTRGNERERSAVLNRVRDAVLNQKLATDASLSGDIASAYNQLAGNRFGIQAGVAGQKLGNQADLWNNWYNTTKGYRDASMNVKIGGREALRNYLNQGVSNAINLGQGPTVSYPDQSMLYNTSAAQGYGSYAYQPPTGILGMFGGGVGGAVGGSILSTMLTGNPMPGLIIGGVGGGYAGNRFIDRR